MGHVVRIGNKNAFRVFTGNLEKVGHWEDLDVDGRILKWILKEAEWLGVGFIHLAQRKHQRWTGVNTVMNLRVPLNERNCLDEELSASQERLSLVHVVGWSVKIIRHKIR
jgi:hypothetical protein